MSLSTDPEKPQHEQDMLAALINGIHRNSSLREWITLESEALPPVPQARSGRWTLVSLLALPYRQPGQTRTVGYLPPWGLVVWSWPECRVLQTLDIRAENPASDPPEPLLFSTVNGQVPPLDTLLAHSAYLFRALEKLLQQPTSPQLDLRLLGELYADLLPPAIYQWYWKYVPESKIWLKVPDTAQKDSEEPEQLSVVLPASSSSAVSAEHDDDDLEGPPADLTISNQNWLKQAFILAEACQAQEITKRLQELQQLLRYPGFRLACVGEFSRGKSTLVNRLLGRDLLPTGGVRSTTNTITSIVYGETERMEVRLPDDKLEQRPLLEKSWDDLLVPLKGGAEQSSFARVRVTLNHPWLRQLDAEIIDTPGINDVNGARSALASDVLYNSDGALFLTSAQVAIGLTETNFLQEKVLGHHVARVAVVVTMLDMIAAKDRLPVMESVREKIGALAPHIPVIASHSLNGDDDKALATLRTQIERMATQAHRRAWRSQKIAGMIATYAQQLAKLGQMALENAQQEYEQKRAVQHNLQNEVKRAINEWETIENELSLREQTLENAIRLRLDIFKKRFQEVARYELSKAPDPRVWWERDFPFRIRQELVAQAQSAESFMRGSIESDLHWLYTRVQETFKVSLGGLQSPSRSSAGPEIRQGQIALTDFQRLRLFSRIGTGIGTVATALLFGPLSIGVSIGAGIISEHQLTKRINEQQSHLASEVDICIENSSEGYISELSTRLRAFYAQAINEVRLQQDTWETSRSNLLKERIPLSQVPQWQQLITSANALQEEIQAALQL